jgi:hypothetical protein
MSQRPAFERPIDWIPALLRTFFLAFVAVGAASGATSDGAPQPAERPKPPGLGDPGQLVRLSIETGQKDAPGFVLEGSQSSQQLVVMGHFATGQLRDLSRTVAFQVDPAGVITVDSSGRVLPLADGQATITAQAPAGLSATVAATVERYGNDRPVNFPNEVVPIFTKYGCNSGGCHGKSSGQNGFRLSLLGFEPGEDFEHLTREARGRRLFPAAPEHSLLLLKATATLPHGGGKRFEVGDPSYEIIRRWIAEGTAYGDADVARVARIEVIPQSGIMPPGGTQQLVVTAHYTDGSTRDVTRLAQYEPNVTEMAEVSSQGLVTTADQTGDVAVMVRYQSQVAVYQATIPFGVAIESMPSERNFIDQLVFRKLKLVGLPPSQVCDDATFLRRSAIDIAGRLPTIAEVQQFLADQDSAKRDRWIDTLLDSAEYADYFAGKWAAILRNKRQNDNYKRGTFGFHDWLRDALYANERYDSIVRQVIAASGDIGQHPPVAWYREVDELNEQVEDTAQLFLGQRIQCARCHHHPFEKWSQQDYYGFAAFFSRIGRKPGDIPDETRIFHQRGPAVATNPKNSQPVKASGLGTVAADIPPEDDPRQVLVDWMAAAENRYFSHALVNRYWKHFFGRGLVEPEDDMRATNPPTNPELLDALARHFTASGFDLKGLARTICQSSAYQLNSEPNEYNVEDRQNFSRYYPKRLAAEVLLDAIDAATESFTQFDGVPQGTRAIQLPDTSFNSYFLTVFGRPESSSACECERQTEANLAQGLHLINSSEIHGKLSANNGRAARLASDAQQSDHDKVRELFLCTLNREPTAEEEAAVHEHVQKKLAENKDNLRVAYEDILWTLINTKEFLFNH